MRKVEINWRSARSFIEVGDMVYLKTKKDIFILKEEIRSDSYGRKWTEKYFSHLTSKKSRVYPSGNTILVIDMDIKNSREIEKAAKEGEETS